MGKTQKYSIKVGLQFSCIKLVQRISKWMGKCGNAIIFTFLITVSHNRSEHGIVNGVDIRW